MRHLRHQLPESPKAPHQDVSRMSHEEHFFVKDGHNICKRAEKHEAKEGEKYNNKYIVDFHKL